MASNDYDIVNMALIRLGANTITALDDGSRNATAANLIYGTIRDEALKAHPWNFATRRAWLDEVAANSLTITGITQADPGVVSYTGTDPSNGDKYEITDIVGMTELNSGQYVVQNVDTDSDTFELMDEDTTAYTAYDSAGTAEQVIPKSGNWAYLYDVPSDCLRILEVNNNPNIEWERTELGMLCNEESVSIVFIRQVTTVSLYSSDFVSLFASRLAGELAVAVTGKQSKAKFWMDAYMSLLQNMKGIDSREQRTKASPANKYANARR